MALMAETRRRSQLLSLGAIIAGIIDPKRTWYGGVWMRSRLEADFARHLDALRIVWRYEPAVFGPEGRGYLPDFQLLRPEGRPTFVEVKPTLPEVAGAKRKMAVIWKTHPDAVLIVACAQGSRFFASEGGADWISWVDRWSHA
jgi:hypothetical protein